MILNCRELTRMLASDELVEASLLHRFEPRLHLLMCRHCRRFAAQLEAIGSAARTSWGAESQSEVQLEQLESRILERFFKDSGGSTSAGRGPDIISGGPDEPAGS